MEDQDANIRKLLGELQTLRQLSESFSLLEEERRSMELAGVADQFRLGWRAKHTRDVFYRIACRSPRLDYIESGCFQIFGYTPQEMVGLNVAQFIRSVEKAGGGEAITGFALEQRCQGDQRPFLIDYLVRTKDSQLRWVTDYCYPWLSEQGKVLGSQGLLRDISQRKQLEEALKESERRLDSILRSVPDIIYRLDARGNITYINDTVRLYGHEPWELIGGSMVELIHPEDRRTARRQIMERRTGDRATKNLEVRLLIGPHPRAVVPPSDVVPEKYRYFRVSAQGLWTEREGEDIRHFLGSQGIARDVTDMKLAEEERLLREKVQAAIATAGAACHQLNQPLQSIMAQTELLLFKLPPQSPFQDGLQVILEQVRRMADITERLNHITQFHTQPYGRSAQILDLKRSSPEEQD